ncbi:MAG: alanine racemase [Bdellovibrionota bacterium]
MRTKFPLRPSLSGSRTVAIVNSRALGYNLKQLIKASEAAHPALVGAVPMVKCNAYGHGLVAVAKKFRQNRKVVALGVATRAEAIELRESGISEPIWVFSDSAPWGDELAGLVSRYRYTPIFHSIEDLRAALAPRYKSLWKRCEFQVKFNTGMNRLGISVEDAGLVRRLVKRSKVRVAGVCSHLACADQPGNAVTRSQTSRFIEVARNFSNDTSYIHCSGTSAILHGKHLGLGALCNVVRPGIGLYGYAGKEGRSLQLKPALKWVAQVLARRDLKASECVGYGATCRLKSSASQAIIGVGYGDGFKRILSNTKILVGRNGKRHAIDVLGRVSMDLTSLRLDLRPGSWVELLGTDIRQAEIMAKNAETIVYELLTSISQRVPRVYT